MLALRRDGSNGRLSLSVTKQKDGPEADEMRLALQPALESAVLMRDDSGPRAPIDRLSPGERACLDALQGSITFTDWQRAWGAGSRATMTRHRGRLTKLGLVVQDGEGKGALYRRAGAHAGGDDEQPSF